MQLKRIAGNPATKCIASGLLDLIMLRGVVPGVAYVYRQTALVMRTKVVVLVDDWRADRIGFFQRTSIRLARG